jgi:hypothetical protein
MGKREREREREKEREEGSEYITTCREGRGGNSKTEWRTGRSEHAGYEEEHSQHVARQHIPTPTKLIAVGTRRLPEAHNAPPKSPNHSKVTVWLHCTNGDSPARNINRKPVVKMPRHMNY